MQRQWLDMRDTTQNNINSFSGYVGCFVLLISLIAVLQLGNISSISPGSDQYMQSLLLLLMIAFSAMLTCEILQRSRSEKHLLLGEPVQALTNCKKKLIHSTILRYGVLMVPWFLLNSLVQNHLYFQADAFNFTRYCLEHFLLVLLIGGIPYIYLTLRYRGGQKFEFNDYAILSFVLCKRVSRRFTKHHAPPQNIWSNHRLRKLILSYAVIFFFLPLMLRFLDSELTGLIRAWNSLMQEDFAQQLFFHKFQTIYNFYFHFIFVIDVSIATIAYAIANRWLNNRVKSVDSTMSGWTIALICYPPLNSIFFDQFLAYNRVATQTVVSSEIGQMILMSFILVLFTIYVWATITLGFKFSNLCNRGIVSHGPYRFMRHPAYTCKNLAWWLENSHVVSNIWASIGLLLANGIYILRGTTEEKHLRQDLAYISYCSRVKTRFLPSIRRENFPRREKAPLSP